MRIFLSFRAVLGIGLTLALSVSVARAQQLPDGLRHMPPDAIGFVHIRVGDLLNSPFGANLLDMIKKDREAAKGQKEIEKTIGITPSDIDTVTLVMLPLPKRMPGQEGFDPFMDGPRPNRYYGKKTKPAFDRDMKREFFPEKFEEKFEKRRDPEEKAIPDPKIEGKKADVNRLADGTYFASAEVSQEFLGGPDSIMMLDGPLAFQPIIIISATKDFDRKAILRKQFFGQRRGDPYGGHFDGGPSVQFLSDRCVAVGMGFQLARFNDLLARDPQPKTDALKSALALASGKHLISGGGQVPAEIRQLMNSPYGGPDTKLLELVSPLLATRSGAALDFDKGISLTLQFDAANANAASNAYQALKTLRTLGQLALEQGGNGGEVGGWMLDLQKAAAKALDTAKIEQKDNQVGANIQFDISPSLMKKLSNELVASVRSRGDRTQSMNNLKNIALSMHGYHDANKRLPAAGMTNVNDPNGKPLLSWRVSILPYIDQGALYQQFDLTQPWDHPTNKRLIANMPHIYIVPGSDEKKGMTHYRVLVGPTTMFEANQKISLVSVTDGSSNTLMVVEAAEATIWTRPDDLPYNPNGPLPKFGLTPDGFLAAFGDGTVRFIRANVPENVIRALITRNGGEAVTIPD
ncbi:MAG: DUF1559 domain-containing protein [Gemmataceae bacterium]|nr:DUF1559 domain-containing protein [Gemmataceae bacterium]